MELEVPTAFLLVFFLMVQISQRVYGSPSDDESKKAYENVFTEKDQEISDQIKSMADDLDLALAGKKIVDSYNRSRITLRNQLMYVSGGPFTYTPHLDVRLHLPNLEKKWQLKFTTYDEDQESLGVNRDRIKTVPIQTEYAAAFGLFQKLGKINAEFQPRIQYQNQVLLSYILRLTSSSTTENYSLMPEMELFANSDTGIGEFFGVTYDIRLYHSLSLSFINQEQYLDRADTLSANNGLSLGYQYNDVMSQNYSLMLQSSSRPNYHLDVYTLSTGFTHRYYKNILHYTIMPYLAFSRAVDFTGSPGINLEIDLIF